MSYRSTKVSFYRQLNSFPLSLALTLSLHSKPLNASAISESMICGICGLTQDYPWTFLGGFLLPAPWMLGGSTVRPRSELTTHTAALHGGEASWGTWVYWSWDFCGTPRKDKLSSIKLVTQSVVKDGALSKRAVGGPFMNCAVKEKLLGGKVTWAKA